MHTTSSIGHTNFTSMFQSELFGGDTGIVGAPKHQIVCKASADNIKG